MSVVLQNRYEVRSSVFNCTRMAYYIGYDLINSRDCQISISPIKYLQSQYSAIKLQLKFFHQNHYPTIQKLYDIFEETWAFANQELQSIVCVLEHIQGHLLCNNLWDCKEQMIALALLQTTEYLKIHTMSVNINIYNIWIVNDSIKISIFGVNPNLNQNCPYCSYLQIRQNYIPQESTSSFQNSLFSIGMTLLEIICKTTSDIIFERKQHSSVLMNLKSVFKKNLLQSPLKQLVSILLDPPPMRLSYDQQKKLIQKEYLTHNSSRFTEAQIQYIKRLVKVKRNSLDLKGIIQDKSAILCNVPLEDLRQLYLQNNSLQSIQFVKGTTLQNVKILDLSFNRIDSINSLPFFISLQKVYLQNNNICNIEVLERCKLERLSVLLLDNNSIRSMLSLSRIKKWELRKLWIYGNNMLNASKEAQLVKNNNPQLDIIF